MLLKIMLIQLILAFVLALLDTISVFEQMLIAEYGEEWHISDYEDGKFDILPILGTFLDDRIKFILYIDLASVLVVTFWK